jgi:hypothetical protein
MVALVVRLLTYSEAQAVGVRLVIQVMAVLVVGKATKAVRTVLVEVLVAALELLEVTLAAAAEE